jgi:sugar phosphate isomerase/epimerase
MKLGFLMPLSVENIARARRLGYDSLEAAVGWLGASTLDASVASLPQLKDAMAKHNVAITSVAIYGGAIEAPVDAAVGYYAGAVELAEALGCGVVSGLTGRDNSKTVAENLPLFKERFDPIARHAADHGVKIALEPWPGSVLGHGPYRWTNLATTPQLWDMLIDAVPAPSLGLEYDPSHLAWQEIDYVQAILDYAERIHHMHAKDIAINRVQRAKVGVHGTGWWRFVLPGLGELPWQAIFDALEQAGYQGDIAVEHEDGEFLHERWDQGLEIALGTLRPLVDAYNG